MICCPYIALGLYLFGLSPVPSSQVCVLWHNPCDSGAVVLDTKNIDEALAGSEFVFINFYADWCRFSNMLSPIWDEFADKAKKEG